jgi:predicted nucleic acid-binding protein
LLQYRRRKEQKGDMLPDFFIGIHAAVAGYRLISRNKGRFSTYFLGVDWSCPSQPTD